MDILIKVNMAIPEFMKRSLVINFCYNSTSSLWKVQHDHASVVTERRPINRANLYKRLENTDACQKDALSQG